MNHFAKLITVIRLLLDIHMLMVNMLCALMEDFFIFSTYVMVLCKVSTIMDNGDLTLK